MDCEDACVWVAVLRAFQVCVCVHVRACVRACSAALQSARSGFRIADLYGDWDAFAARFARFVGNYQKRYPALVVDVAKEVERCKDFGTPVGVCVGVRGCGCVHVCVPLRLSCLPPRTPSFQNQRRSCGRWWLTPSRL
jgi:hypothetical protein